MTDKKIINAKIEHTMLGTADYGYMSFVLTLKFNGCHQGFGTYDLRFFGVGLIEKILSIVGVSTWEELEGKCIRIEKGGLNSTITRIGNLLDDKWLDMEQLAEIIKNKKETQR